MSKNSNKALQIVERYYKIYTDYENAFNKGKKPKESVIEELKTVLAKNKPNEDDFKDFAKEQYIGESQKSLDVQFAANKFIMAVNFYKQLETEELPTNMKKDYENLNKMVYKPTYSVDNETMVRNEKIDDSKIDFETLYKELKNRFSNE